jgi:hypothetical protein
LVDTYENKIGPRNGAKVVARAWVDPAYKERLITDATAAIKEFGFSGLQGEDMVVVENTPEVHNLVDARFAPATLGRRSDCHPMNSDVGQAWTPGDPRKSKLVVIGRDLPKAKMIASLERCLTH